jgi:hypothetical protein
MEERRALATNRKEKANKQKNAAAHRFGFSSN